MSLIKHLLKVVLLVIGVYAPSASADQHIIEANKAPFHVGETIMTCGNVLQIKRLKKRTYLNIDGKYPNQLISIMIWNSNLYKFREKFGDLNVLQGRRICVLGEIKEYRGNLEVMVSKANFLRLMNSK
jgi:hypothetical protein